MTTEELVNELSARVRPVRRVEHPVVGLLRWAALSALCVAAGIAAFGVRADLASAARSPAFLLLAALALASGATATLAALLASVPGMDRPWFRAVPVALFTLAVALPAHAMLSAGGVAGSGITCVERIVALSLLPSVMVLAAVRNAAPLAAGRVGMLVILGASAPGAFAIQFICQHDDPLHVLVWHYVPMAAAASVGAALSRRWLASWDAR